MINIGNFLDPDGSLKSVFKEQKNIIEMTLLQNRPNTDVICVPTHHFCNLGCKMCHLTNNNLNKSMIPIEYNNFKNALYETLCDQNERRTNKKYLLISFMGVGEPLLNIKLLKAVFLDRFNIARDLNYDNVGFSLSTMLPTKLDSLINIVNEYSIPLKVHFSLHTPIDDNRKDLIPAAKMDIDDCLYELKKYQDEIAKNKFITAEYVCFHKTRRLTEVHYTLIENKNDSDIEKQLIIELLQKYNLSIKFISFNPIGDLKPSKKENEWIDDLQNAGIFVKQYSPPGKLIGSSCGEFTKHYYHEEIETDEQFDEFLSWKLKYEIK